MPPQSINRNRVTATPRKRSLGLRGMLSGGVSGGEFIPGSDGYTPTEDELYEAEAFMDETPVTVAPTPGSFSPVTVNRPVMDMLFGRGQAAAQAGQINSAQQMALAQMEAQRQAAIMANRAAMEREQFGQGAAMSRQRLSGEQAIEQLNRSGHISNLAKRNLSPDASASQLDVDAMAIANAEDAAKRAAQSQPWYQGEVAGNMRAQLQKPGVENAANSRVTVAPDMRVFSNAMTPDTAGRLFEYPGSTSYSKQSPVMMSIDGKSFPTGQMTREEGINRTSGGYLDEAQMALQKKRDEMERLGQEQRQSSFAPPKAEIKQATPAQVSAAPLRNPSLQSADDGSKVLGIIQQLIKSISSSGGKKENESWNEYYKRTGKVTN